MPGYFNAQIRRRFAPLMLVGAAVLVGRFASDDMPRDQEVRLELGEGQREARTVRLVYTRKGEEITGVLVRYPQGAPALVVHHASLSPGLYDLAIELRYGDGRTEQVAKTLTVPSEGAVKLPLHPHP
jgi:hypothetical protein